MKPDTIKRTLRDIMAWVHRHGYVSFPEDRSYSVVYEIPITLALADVHGCIDPRTEQRWIKLLIRYGWLMEDTQHTREMIEEYRVPSKDWHKRYRVLNIQESLPIQELMQR